MVHIKFDPDEFSKLAKLMVSGQPTEASLRTAVGRVYYSVYLRALYHLFADGNPPPNTVREAGGSHAVTIRGLRAVDSALGNKLRRLQQLRIQADYRLVPDHQFSDWETNRELAQVLEADIRNAYARHGF